MGLIVAVDKEPVAVCTLQNNMFCVCYSRQNVKRLYRQDGFFVLKRNGHFFIVELNQCYETVFLNKGVKMEVNYQNYRAFAQKTANSILSINFFEEIKWFKTEFH